MTKHAGGALLPSIAIDRAAAAPLGAQLARSLRELILTAVLRPGDRLPSSRTLAAELGLSRTTVVDTYDQLTAEGLIVSRVGDGAYVSDCARRGAARPGAGLGGRRQAAGPARATRPRGVGSVLSAHRPPAGAAGLRHRHAGLRRLPDGALGAALGPRAAAARGSR